MIEYKGFSFPTKQEFIAKDKEYTDPNNPDQWIYSVGGIKIEMPKHKSSKEIVDSFHYFVDTVYEDARKVMKATGEMTADVSKKNKALLDELATKKVEEKAKELNIDIATLAAATAEGGVELTDEQVEKINEAYKEVVEESDELKAVAELPSNNGVEETPEETKEEGEFKDMAVSVDPVSGENRILGDASDLLDNETFDEMLERINNDELTFGNDAPLEEEEIEKYLNPENAATSMVINEVIDKDYPLSKDAVKSIMLIANRRMKKESFNVYKELPEEVKTMIDKYMNELNDNVKAPINSTQYKTMRNRVSEALIDDFINSIAMDRATSDFNKEVQEIFNKNATDVSETIVGYSKEKLESYRKSLINIEDPEKRERLEKVLERIDDGYSLTSLKEFAKHCKIKKFDLEKPEKEFADFRRKYKDSSYDAFSIEMASSILMRQLNPGEETLYTADDIAAFFLAFVKQTMNYHADDILDHSYMYYVTYNIVLTDINKAESTRATSEEFLNNVKEVIQNLRERNPHLKGE